MKKNLLVVSFLGMLFLGLTAHAQLNWTNLSTGAWSNNSVWGGGTAPTSGSNDYTVIFNNAATDNSTNNLGAFLLNQLIVTNAGTVNLYGSNLVFAINSAGTILPQLLVNGGNGLNIYSGVTLNTNLTVIGNAQKTVAFNAAISGAGALIVSNNAGGNYNLVVFNAANTYTGGTQIKAARLQLGNTAATLGSGDVTIFAGGELYISTGVTISNNFYIAGNYLGENLGAIRMDSGTLNGTITLTGDTVIGANSGTGIINAPIGGNYGLWKVGVGATVLNGTNTFNGGLTVLAGALTLNNSNSYAAANVTGGLLLFGSTNAISGSGTMVVNGGAVGFNFPGAIDAVTNRVALLTGPTGGTLALTATNAAEAVDFSGAYFANAYLGAYGTVTNSGVYTPNVAGVYRYGGGTGILVITNQLTTGSVVIGGGSGGTVTFAASNSFGGGVTISNNFLKITNKDALGNGGGVTIVAPTMQTELQLSSGSSGNWIITNQTLTTDNTGSGNVPSLRNVDGTNTWGGAVAIQGAGTYGLNFFADAGLLTISANITNVNVPAGNAAVFLRGNGVGILSGTLNLGNAVLRKGDGGTWYINSTGNTWQYSYIENGKIILGTNDALAVGGDLRHGSTPGVVVNLNGYNQQLLALNSTRTDCFITNGNAGVTSTLTLSNATTTAYNYYSSIRGNLALVLQAGIQTLYATNTYTGGTTINGGTLLIGTTNAVGTGPLAVNFGGGIGLTNSPVDQTFLNWVASRVTNDVTGAIVLGANSSSNLTFSGVLSNAYLGAGGAYTYSGIYTPATNTYRLGMGGGVLTFSGVLADTNSLSYGLNVAGPGVVLLTATNTYTGPTTVFGGGELRLNALTNLPAASNLILSNGVLELNNLTFTRGLGTGSNQVQLTGASGFGAGGNNATINLWNNSNATVIWGTNGFTPDVLVLQGPLSTGNTVTFNNPINLMGTNRAVNVNSPVGTGVAVLSGAISNSASNGVGLIKGGPGVLQISGANTYDGSTIVTGGVLRLGGNAVTTTALPAGNLVLSNGVLEINYGVPGIASFTRSLGTGLNQIFIVSGTTNGFSAVNGPRTINLGGTGTSLTWGSADFNPAALVLGESSASARTILANGLDLNGTNRTITVNTGSILYGALITGVITNTAATPAGLVKAGSGSLFVLGNNYAYDGPTIIAAGNIVLGDSHTANGTLPSNVITNYGTLIFNNPAAQTFAATVIGTGGLTKNGRGALTITGSNNNFIGTTTINAGQLILDYSLGGVPTANLLPVLSALTLAQDATLYIKGTGGSVSNAQTFRALTVNLGASRIIADSNGGTISLNLAGITRGANNGGVLDFILPANGEITTTTFNAGTGILGGYATVNGTDWAAVGNLYYLAQKITNYTGYATLAGANPIIANNSNANVLVDTASTGNPTFGAATNLINTLAFKDTTDRTIDIGTGTNLILGPIGGILVAPGAGAQTIGVAGSAGALTAGGAPGVAGELVFINNSTNALTVNSRLANNGAGTLTVTVAGSGGVNLAGTNFYTGNTFINGLATFSGSNTLVNVNVDSGGTLTFSGTTYGTALRIGQASGSRGTVYVTGNTTFTNQLILGTGAEAANSAGALIQTGGLLSIPSVGSGAFLGDSFQSYGYVNLAGGTLIISNAFNIGHRGYCVFEVTGGTNAATSASVTVANGDTRCAAMGLLYVSSGLFNAGTGGNEIRINGASYVGTYGVITVTGDGVINAAANSLTKGLNLMVGAGNTGIVNVNTGGTVIANYIYAGNTVGLSVLNLNGGTIVAAPGTTQGGSFFANISAVYLNPGGVTFDTGTNAITISNNLLAPAGSGVTNISFLTPGGGYIGNPLVYIGGGTGTGATAIAQIDFSTGQLTNILVTSTGSGYLPGDVLTVNLYGGGFTNPATIGTVQFGPNTNTGAITKLGTGTLTLTGTNTFAGGINVSNGVLVGTTFSLLGPITNSGGVIFSQNFDGTFNGVITGSGFLGKQNAGLVVLTNANSYLGNTIITGGVLRADYGVGITTAGNLVLSNAIWETGANITNALGTGAGQIRLLGGTAGFSAFGNPVTVNLGGSGTNLVWGTDLPLGSLVLNSAYANTNLTFVNALDLNGTNRTITVNAATATITGPITSGIATGSLVKAGAGTLELTGTNTYDGLTTINAGTLSVSYLADLGLPSNIGITNIAFGGGTFRYTGPDITINRAGTLTANSGVDVTSGNLEITGVVRGNTYTLTKTGNGTLTLSGTLDNDSLWVGVSNGVVVLNKTTGGAYARIAGVRFISNGATIQLSGNNGDQIYGGAGFGITNLNGTVDMNGRNESISGFWGGSSGLVTNTSSTNSVLTVGESNDNGNFGGTIAGNVALTKIGTGTAILTGTNTYSGATTINAGTLQFGAGGPAGTPGTGPITNSSRLVFNFSDNLALANSLVGTGVVIKTGLGTLAFTNTAANIGTLSVANGAVQFIDSTFSVSNNSVTAIGNTAGQTGLVHIASGTVSLGYFQLATAVVSTYGIVTQSGGAVTAPTGFIIGQQGTGRYDMTGGTLTPANFRNANNGPGTFNLSGGTVTLAGGFWISENGTGTVTVSGSGVITSTSSADLANKATGNGTLNLDLGGTVNLPGLIKSSGTGGTVNFNGGLLRFTASTTVGPLANTAFNILANGAVIDTTNNAVTIAQDLQDGGTGGGLTKLGSATLTLTGTNTYTGSTIISNGTLAIGASALMANTVCFELHPGTILDVTAAGLTLGVQELKGSGTVLGSVTAGTGATITPGNSVGTLTVGNLSLTNGVTLNFELGATNASDKVIVNNALSLDGMNTNWFVLSAVGGFGVGEYTLFDATSIIGSLGSETNFANINGYTGYLWLDTGANDVKLTVVPEPGTGTLVGAGLLAMFLLGRWRRR